MFFVRIISCCSLNLHKLLYKKMVSLTSYEQRLMNAVVSVTPVLNLKQIIIFVLDKKFN